MAIGDSTRVNTNIAALNALNALKSVNRNLEISQLRLATGLRINEVADDPAGFTISKRLDARSRGLSVALDNVGTAKNVLSIAEGGLLNIQKILIQMKEKVTQAKSDTMGPNERNAIKEELDQLSAEINDIVRETQFNSVPLIDGTYTGKSFQTGEGKNDTLAFSISSDYDAETLLVNTTNLGNKVITDQTDAAQALQNVNDALGTIASELQGIGATIVRMTFKEDTLRIAITNTESTKSRILDSDIANEQLKSTRLQILQQTATAQLAQANVAPQNVLALFQ
ncbi:flagellin [candidate division KSB1 bacterium]